MDMSNATHTHTHTHTYAKIPPFILSLLCCCWIASSEWTHTESGANTCWGGPSSWRRSCHVGRKCTNAHFPPLLSFSLMSQGTTPNLFWTTTTIYLSIYQHTGGRYVHWLESVASCLCNGREVLERKGGQRRRRRQAASGHLPLQESCQVHTTQPFWSTTAVVVGDDGDDTYFCLS